MRRAADNIFIELFCFIIPLHYGKISVIQMDTKIQNVLEILEENAKTTPEEISELTRIPVEEVREMIRSFEENGIIRSYRAIIDWSQVREAFVYASVQIKVSLERGSGYEKIAERICRFKNVVSLRLLSGDDYDLQIMVRGKTMQEVAFFVADKVATLDQIQSTSTHFILKTYKEEGVIMLDEDEGFKRLHVTP